MEQIQTNSFSINESIKFAWELFKKHAVYLIVVGLILFGVSAIFSSIENHIRFGFISWLVSLLSYVVNIIISMAIIKIILEFLDGHSNPSWEKISSSFPLFWKYLGGTILTSLIVMVGFILLIIPGIYAMLRLQFVSYFIVDKGLAPLDAMKESSELTKDIKFELLLFLIVLCGINLLGFIALGIGLLVSVPVSMIAIAYVYRTLSGCKPIITVDDLPTQPEVHIGSAVPTDKDEDLLN